MLFSRFPLALACSIVSILAAAPAAHSTAMVDLGPAASYAVLSGPSVANTVSAPGAPHTIVHGNLGVASAAVPTGFPPGEVTGGLTES